MDAANLLEGVVYHFRSGKPPEIRSGILKCLSDDGCYAILTRSENATEKVPIPWLFETREQAEEMASK